MFENKIELNPFLIRAGLTRYAGVMERLCIPSVCFEKVAGDGDGASRPGVSRTGGAPDLQCNAEMRDWTLLLQVGLADLWSIFGEGTVSFVMRDSDLKQRDFSRVHAIYQQT